MLSHSHIAPCNHSHLIIVLELLTKSQLLIAIGIHVSLHIPILYHLGDCNGQWASRTRRPETTVHTYSHTHVQPVIHTYSQSYTRTVIHTYSQSYTRTVVHTYSHTHVQSYTHTVIHTYSHTHVQSYTRTMCLRLVHTEQMNHFVLWLWQISVVSFSVGIECFFD